MKPNNTLTLFSFRIGLESYPEAYIHACSSWAGAGAIRRLANCPSSDITLANADCSLEFLLVAWRASAGLDKITFGIACSLDFEAHQILATEALSDADPFRLSTDLQ